MYWQEGSNRKDVLNPWEITETQTANESEASPQEIHNGWGAVTCFPVNTDMVTARTDDDKQINHGALLALMASIEFSSNAAMDVERSLLKDIKTEFVDELMENNRFKWNKVWNFKSIF